MQTKSKRRKSKQNVRHPVIVCKRLNPHDCQFAHNSKLFRKSACKKLTCDFVVIKISLLSCHINLFRCAILFSLRLMSIFTLIFGKKTWQCNMIHYDFCKTKMDLNEWFISFVPNKNYGNAAYMRANSKATMFYRSNLLYSFSSKSRPLLSKKKCIEMVSFSSLSAPILSHLN